MSDDERRPLALSRRLPAKALRGARLALGAALDLFWPPVCPGCGAGREPGEPGLLCEGCRTELPLIGGPACRRCGVPLGPFESDHDGRWCADCGRMNLVFTRAATAGVHEGPLAEVIKAWKYAPRGSRAYLGRYLADLVAERLAAPDCPVRAGECDVIVPAPSHPARVRERGFDHTLELARHLGRRLGLPVERGSLVKLRATPRQAGLSRAERLENLAGAFAVRRPERLAGRRVLLVDDVITTAATTEECARALKAAGVREVWAAAVARATAGRVVRGKGAL
ncbi:MAG TPA: ComF family protein [Planctomycetota bacterium]|nr:ComF family protein [Planctomycetota bacterium]